MAAVPGQPYTEGGADEGCVANWFCYYRISRDYMVVACSYSDKKK